MNTASEFRWAGQALGGLLNGNHHWHFEASDQKPGRMKFVHAEELSGFLAFLFSDWSPGGSWLRNKFEKFNQDLKKRVESMKLA